MEKTKPGGPWRARKDRVGIFVYYFVRHNLMFEFNTKSLCKVLEKLTKKKGFICVKNRGWAVLGWKVSIPRVLEELATAGASPRIITFTHAGIDGAYEYEHRITKEKL